MPPNQNPQLPISYILQTHSFSEQTKDRNSSINQIKKTKYKQDIKSRPYAGANRNVKYMCSLVWPDDKRGNELGEKTRWTGPEIQDFAVKNFHTLSYEQLMDIIAFCVKQKNFVCHNLLDYLLESVNNNFEKDTTVWDSKSVAQLMFCAFVYGYRRHNLFRQVEKHIEKHLSIKQYEMSEMEAVMILCAYNRCSKQFTSVEVIRKFWSIWFAYYHKMTKTSISSENKSHMYMFLRQMCHYTSHLNSLEQLQAIGNYGCHLHLVEDHITVMQCLSTVRFYHAPFVDKVIQKIEELSKNNVSVRVKTLAIFSEFVANYELQESKTDRHCFDNLSKLFELSSGEAAMSANYFPKLAFDGGVQKGSKRILIDSEDRCIMRFALGMVMAGRIPQDLISILLGKGLDSSDLYPKDLLLLQACVDIECPNYTGNRLSLPKFVSDKRVFQNAKGLLKFKKSDHNHLSKLVLTTVDSIVGEQLYHYHSLLPYGNEVIELRLDEERRPTKFVKLPYYRLTDTFKSSGTGIAILLHNRRQTTFNGGAPLGRLKTQRRHLRKLGYQVVEVPILSPEELRDAKAEQKMTGMLRQKLEQDCNVVLEKKRPR